MISKDEEELEVREQVRNRDENMSEGWNTVVSWKNRYTGRGRSGARRDVKTYANLVRATRLGSRRQT